MKSFEQINRGYNSVFQVDKLSLGIVIPIENYTHGPVPTMRHHVERVKLAEACGFKSLWVRDVPFNVPSFGDAGQTFDPFTYLGFLAGQTTDIALGTGSIALPLHHPLHVAKSAATIDQFSDGRLILGVASGDRYEEYPAMGIDYDSRGKLFRSSFEYIRKAQDNFPTMPPNDYGMMNGQIDVLPKATKHKIPMIVTGRSRQSLEWNAINGDGWMYYPRNLQQHQQNISEWRNLVLEHCAYNKPFCQPLYVDLMEDDDFKPTPIHLGFRIGAKYLIQYLELLRELGVNLVMINLRFNQNSIEKTLEQMGKKVLPHFHTSNQKETI